MDKLLKDLEKMREFTELSVESCNSIVTYTYGADKEYHNIKDFLTKLSQIDIEEVQEALIWLSEKVDMTINEQLTFKINNDKVQSLIDLIRSVK